MSQLKYTICLIDDGASEFESPMYECMCSNVQPDPDGTPFVSEDFKAFLDYRFQPQHFHIQCSQCFQTYCPFQQCVPPPTAEVIDHYG